MDKEDVYGRIASCGVVAVIRADTGEAALRIAEACISGGITAVELTFTVPFADQILRELAARHKGGSATVGAGTVLDPETARIALLSGAQYVVSPSFNPEVVRLCNRYRTLCVPGVMTVGEAVAAMEAGADMLKVFPSGLFGKAIIKDFLGPLPYAKLMPTGGVTDANAGEWLLAGAVAVGAGSQLTAGAAKGDYKSVEAMAGSYRSAVDAARKAIGKGGA